MKAKIVFLLIALGAACGQSARSPADPIVVLVSFDGWRADYTARAAAPHLKGLAARGVRAEAFISIFPSRTFPAHYTMVTGLYPEHHGIVSNAIRDPAFPERFTMSAQTAKDPRWWGGEPLWVSAIRQGKKSAAMFWPGSEAAIGGIRPTYWRPYDESVSNENRIRQVLEWLALPDTERPSFVMLYFSDVDSAGHDFGPESEQVMTAAAGLDIALGQLISGIDRLGLTARTTIVAVSDHGMASLDDRRMVFLDDYVDPSTVDIVEWTPILEVAPRGITVEELYARLSGKHPALTIYMRDQLPAHLHHGHNERIAPIIGISEEGWSVSSHERSNRAQAAGDRERGDHGYDPQLRSMHGLFVAAGPQLRRGIIVPRVGAIDTYEFLCRILNITPAPNDGDPSASRAWFID